MKLLPTMCLCYFYLFVQSAFDENRDTWIDIFLDSYASPKINYSDVWLNIFSITYTTKAKMLSFHCIVYLILITASYVSQVWVASIVLFISIISVVGKHLVLLQCLCGSDYKPPMLLQKMLLALLTPTTPTIVQPVCSYTMFTKLFKFRIKIKFKFQYELFLDYFPLSVQENLILYKLTWLMLFLDLKSIRLKYMLETMNYNKVDPVIEGAQL